MGLRIPALLDAILEATAAEAAAKARIARLRATLETEARRRYAEEGAAPTWKAPKAGVVRFDPPGDPVAVVADEDAWATWVREQYPAEHVATIVIGPEHVEAAAQALGFAGVEYERVEGVRPAWAVKFLEGLEVEVEEVLDPDVTPGVGPGLQVAPASTTVYTVVDPASGEVIPALTGRVAGNGRLVVSLDRDRKARALEDAMTAADLVVEAAEQEATGDRGTAPEDEVGPIGGPDLDDPYESDSEAEAFARSAPSVIAIMDAGSREDLRAYAKSKGLAAHGTKGELAIRLSASGHTAEQITATLDPGAPE